MMWLSFHGPIASLGHTSGLWRFFCLRSLFVEYRQGYGRVLQESRMVQRKTLWIPGINVLVVPLDLR